MAKTRPTQPDTSAAVTESATAPALAGPVVRLLQSGPFGVAGTERDDLSPAWAQALVDRGEAERVMADLPAVQAEVGEA